MTGNASIAEKARRLLLLNRIQEEYTVEEISNIAERGRGSNPNSERRSGGERTNKSLENQTVIFSFPVPCQGVDSVLESTSTLLAARASVKAGESRYGWESIDSLFALQSSNGFVPRYRYSAFSGNSMYINGTTLPNAPIFGKVHVSDYLPPQNTIAAAVGLRGSGLISAPPHHGTTVLEMFYQSNQTSEDVEFLKTNFIRVYNYHRYLHEVVMSGCNTNTNSSTKRRRRKLHEAPCYNIIHPWETLLEPDSEIWKMTLRDTIQRISDQQWSLPSDMLPTEVSNSFDYPGHDVYSAFIYILECHSNATKTFVASNEQSEFRRYLLKHCPFAMVDVGYAALLSQSDTDMLKVANILKEKNRKTNYFAEQVSDLEQWESQSRGLLSELWNSEHQSFISHFVNLSFLGNESSDVPLPVSTGFNFLAVWDEKLDSALVDATAMHLLEKEGDFAFDCGNIPLWSKGGCNKTASALIYPCLNYFVLTGFRRNAVSGIAQYMLNTTIKLVDGSGYGECGLFSRAYDSLSFEPYTGNSVCGRTSTETAALIYNLAVPDKPFTYESNPPIQSTWVFVLIAIELVVGFAVGVSCLVLNLILMRQLRATRRLQINGDSTSLPAPFEHPSFFFLHTSVSADDSEGLLDDTDESMPHDSSSDRVSDHRGIFSTIFRLLNPSNLDHENSF